MSNEKEKKKKEKLETLESVAQSGAATEVVGRYGSAIKEHFVAYSGTDNETGEQLKKGLKDIKNHKINPEFKDQNLKQQAGFAAENKYAARQNAEHIIKGDKTRVHNTDIKGSGSYNELFDHIVKDEHGNIISAEQMKFVGSSPKEALEKLASSKYEKYLDANAKITVPSDFYEEILQEADKSIAGFEKQLERAKQDLEKAKQTGNTELISKKEQLIKDKTQQIQKYEKIKSNLKDSEVTNAEAMEARLNPIKSTAKDIAKISHRAGVEQAKFGAIIGGGFSLIQNIVAVNKGEKSAKEVAISVAGNAGKGAVVAYTTAFVGSSIKGAMQNASSSTVRALAKTNIAGTIVAVTKEVSVTMYKYINGEIDGLECLEQLGEKGTGMLSSAMFATLGQMAIPIPVVGAMAGSMLGYALSTAFYGELVNSMKAAKFAKAERERIEKECVKAIEMIKAYRAELQVNINEYLSDHIAEFSVALKNMDDMYKLGDTDGFIKNANRITQKLGGEVQFKNFDEFNDLINSGGIIEI
ncbi:hypothetical protein OFO10_02270 [Campylobacter sp. VBCF_06 NA8]|uniref:hypothetical protein n=1 Tax=Campylobacter sp. VBCF_06 NA8 TaxID=2983822 RepID=UPI0022E9CB07|nr:hypothetical protein [Campylobacter sp. VBCF_06 NA8]MDA3045980.1 hypothetical protein [Campylobacter sp. VBCF_06 NA8]